MNRWYPAIALVLGGKQQYGERLEGGRQLIKFSRLKDLIRLTGEVVGEGLDPLLDGATLLAQPTTVSDSVQLGSR